MIEILGTVFFSLLTGLFSHITFYPVIEKWANQRMKRLARPTIGVVINAIPFLVWVRLMQGKELKTNTSIFAAYCTSFLWMGAGVVVGYLLDDVIYDLKNKP